MGRAGFSLVEVAMALGIVAFALLAVVGLLPVGLNSNSSAIEQTITTNIATEIISDLRQAPVTGGKSPDVSPRLGIPITSGTVTLYLDECGGPYPGPTSSPSTRTPTSRYRADISLAVPPSNLPKTSTLASLRLSWPAAATPQNAKGFVSFFVALDRN